MSARQPRNEDDIRPHELISESEPAAVIYGKGCPRPTEVDDSRVWGESDPAVSIWIDCSSRNQQEQTRD